jgi:hypothetical protein
VTSVSRGKKGFCRGYVVKIETWVEDDVRVNGRWEEARGGDHGGGLRGLSSAGGSAKEGAFDWRGEAVVSKVSEET